MDVALCDDNAGFKVNLSAGADQLTSGGSGKVAALADWSLDSECAGIGERHLDLRRGASRSEDYDVRNGLLRSDDGCTLFAGVLTGLAEVLLLCEGCALSVKGFDMLFGKVDMSCRGFDQNFHFENLLVK